MEERIQL